ncbi:protoporphyrinogen oxidase [Paenarthrobacter sp. MSM-2-10-13]|uniref:protoporphyrinogen oxidase n=1 Tax=unclassified Paenarthrobacter TaxID=2634190 RepID=UPI00141E0335|nr:MULTISPECIES: protoporphyrinogen oxidase [unclassified Paenarthrobacter]MCM0617631.1 protoporphyrinogen oxidase [Paenarthrobacter sp. TYUT067]NHW45625.1 protoporphyrinogen oxidase [Paenarthrobacter sp. MSM-2-10-13]
MRAGHATSTSEPIPAAARPTAVVVGGGISGLIAARELAAAGSAVTVLEATTAWGGCVGSHVVAGLRLDSGAESFATRSTAVADLARELGLADHIVAPHPGGAWVQLPDGPQELPKTGVLGIPANPWDPEVRRSLGLLGAIRASFDRWLPASVGTSAEVTSVAALVGTRMGKRVLERLVSPVVGGVHSADPALLDVDMVAPGLRAGIRSHGSLAAAVAAQRKGAKDAPSSSSGASSGTAKAGSAVAGLKGGMNTLVDALVADLQERGVQLLAGRRAEDVVKTEEGWRVTAESSTYDAGRLVVALDGPAAVRLLEKSLPVLSGLRPAPGPLVSLVTLVVDLPQLDGRPRGTGILVAPETPGIKAKALTHATAKWDWLADEAGPGTHVLRLSYGRREVAGGGADVVMDDESLLTAAVADASALLTVPVSKADIVDWDVVRWAGALPFAAVGHKQRVAEVRQACASANRLTVVGGWLAGNGLAAVVADTRAQVARVHAG